MRVRRRKRALARTRALAPTRALAHAHALAHARALAPPPTRKLETRLGNEGEKIHL